MESAQATTNISPAHEVSLSREVFPSMKFGAPGSRCRIYVLKTLTARNTAWILRCFVVDVLHCCSAIKILSVSGMIGNRFRAQQLNACIKCLPDFR